MRRIRWVDLLLIAAIVPLGVLAWRTAGERSRLEATLARYEARVGHLDIPDRSKVYLRALPTGSPTEFTWRAFYPAAPGGCRLDSELGLAGGTGGWTSAHQEGEVLWRLNLREQPGWGIELWLRQAALSGRSSLGNRAITELIRGRWDQLRVEQAGVEDVLIAEPTEPVVVIRIFLSPEMMAEAAAPTSPLAGKLSSPEVFRLTLNPPNVNSPFPAMPALNLGPTP